MPLFVALLLSVLLSASSRAQLDISGAWAITVVDFGLPNTSRLVLKQDGDKLTGTLGNQALEGTLAGAEISFKAGNREATGKLALVLRIAPGDTVKTWSVGADGVDAKRDRRSPGGNPQTGPFYVEGAMPESFNSRVGTQVSIAAKLPKSALAKLRKAS